MDRTDALEDEPMYRTLVQGVTDYAIYMLSSDGTVMNWNVGAERAKGYAASEIVGRNFEVFYTEEDRRSGRPGRVLAQARAVGRYEGEGWRLRRDGTRFWAHVVVDAIRDEGSRLLGFAKVTRDLTDRMRLYDRVHRLTDRLDLALRNMSQGLVLFDGEERMAMCNDRWREMFDISDEVFPLGGSLAQLLHLHYAELGGGDAEVRVAERRESLLAGLARTTGTITEEMKLRGRTLVLSRRPLPGGGWVTTTDDVTDRRRVERKAAYLARHDVLTGLPNRTAIQTAVEEARAEAEADPPRLNALLYIDLDRFKPVNDTFGHKAGDLVLRTVARRIRSHLRRRDVAARLGGDEFAIVARDCPDGAAAETLAGRLIASIEEPVEVEGGRVSVGASIGIALVPPGDLDTDALLHHADLALYRAKAEGRGRVRIYDESLEAATRRRAELDRALRRALAEGGFDLNYQPVVDVGGSRVTGFEALLRWNDPEGGVASPADFIPFAEEVGLMPGIDEWVLRMACAEATGWPKELTVSVNLSPVSFARPGLADLVTGVLADSGLEPGRLEIEITETAAIDDLRSAATTLLAVRALGVGVALDDFGTGHSSLSLVRALPFTRIKIDRSFVGDVDTRVESAAIVTAVCGLCRKVGARVTAEGVETAEQIEVLRAEGCTDFQGYFFSRPLPASAVPDWLHAFGSSPSSASTES